MCKYLSGVSGPTRVALYARVQSRCSTSYIRTHSYTRTQTRSRWSCARKPQYASGNRVNTCIKMSAFACLHPRPRYPPSEPLPPDPVSYRSAAILSCLCAVVDVILARMHSVKMSSDLERASRMLTFPARRGMITLMTYIGGRQCNRVSATPPFHPRERQSMRMLAKRTTNFVFGYRFV